MANACFPTQIRPLRWNQNSVTMLPSDNVWRKTTTMKTRLIIAAAVATAFAMPAFGADGYYVVQDMKTKKCTITETKPTTSETTVVSGNTIYKTRAEAETGMKTVKVCTSN